MLDLLERCPYRRNVRGTGDSERAECDLLREITGVHDARRCEVRRDACHYCAHSEQASPRHINPVLASLLHALAGDILLAGGVPGCDAPKAAQLSAWAEANLDNQPSEVDRAVVRERAVEFCASLGPRIETDDASACPSDDVNFTFHCHHPAHLRTTLSQCARCPDWTARPGAEAVPIERMLPVSGTRSGPLVRRWAIGVTTAPRRRPTLERTLESLFRAGFDAPHLFVDGEVEIPAKYSHLPSTLRRPNAGEWPNFYLALGELIMRDPDADAYMMIQDDVEFYDRANLRAYLEALLWPGTTPCPVSLYSAALDTRPEFGWFAQKEPWFRGALAFLFPASLVQTLLVDDTIINHRRLQGLDGVTGTDAVVGEWAFRNGTPIHSPTPSLCRHIGHASSLWIGTSEGGGRRGGLFAGDVRELLEFDRSGIQFPESAFPCAPRNADGYDRRVSTGRERMRAQSAVICALCRDVRRLLPATAARVERLGSLFRDFRSVFFEHDSVDGTFTFLRTWAHTNSRVHLLSRRLTTPEAIADRDQPYTIRLARFRDAVRRYAVDHFGDFDHVLVIDPDAAGGWSLDGIANTFGHDEWDFVGANGLHRYAGLGAGSTEPTLFDVWSFRRPGDESSVTPDELRATIPRRGEPFVPVASCFGGLGIYRMECMRLGSYVGDGTCEHVSLHGSLRAAGFERLFLNPSQIVLYDTADPEQNPLA